jgi:hypothetical protein
VPYVCCPVCNGSMHLAIRTSLEDWEREHVKERDSFGVPLMKCPGCWVELRPGHQVRIRALTGQHEEPLEVGQLGVVELVGPPITVRFDGLRAMLAREELAYVLGQPALNQEL